MKNGALYLFCGAGVLYFLMKNKSATSLQSVVNTNSVSPGVVVAKTDQITPGQSNPPIGNPYHSQLVISPNAPTYYTDKNGVAITFYREPNGWDPGFIPLGPQVPNTSPIAKKDIVFYHVPSNFAAAFYDQNNMPLLSDFLPNVLGNYGITKTFIKNAIAQKYWPAWLDKPTAAQAADKKGISDLELFQAEMDAFLIPLILANPHLADSSYVPTLSEIAQLVKNYPGLINWMNINGLSFTDPLSALYWMWYWSQPVYDKRYPNTTSGGSMIFDPLPTTINPALLDFTFVTTAYDDTGNIDLFGFLKDIIPASMTAGQWEAETGMKLIAAFAGINNNQTMSDIEIIANAAAIIKKMLPIFANSDKITVDLLENNLNEILTSFN